MFTGSCTMAAMAASRPVEARTTNNLFNSCFLVFADKITLKGIGNNLKSVFKLKKM
jgi:hypothetical protein